MNIQHLRHSLKVKWLLYYRQNRPWLVRLRIWGTYDGQRRPSSSFILAALANSEPQLVELFPFIIDLSNDPDQIVAALGLNFNPEQELKSMTEAPPVATTNANGNGLSRQALPKVVDEQEAGGKGDRSPHFVGMGREGAGGTALASLPRNEVKQGLHSPTEELISFLSGEVQSTSVNPPTFPLERAPLPLLKDNLSLPVPHQTIDEDNLSLSTQASNLPSWIDESCHGKASPNNGLVLSILLAIGVLAIACVGFA